MAKGEARAAEKAAVAEQRVVEQRLQREKVARARAELGGLWSRRDVFGRFAWSVFAAFSGISLLAALRSAFPRILFQPPTTFKAGFLSDFTIGEVNTKFQKDQRVWLVREEEGMYALARRREQVQVPVPRQRVLQERHQLRGTGAPPARAPADHEGRRRPDRGRQGNQIPLRKRRMGQTGRLPEGVTRCPSGKS
jgi:hypothetical protein